MTYCVSRAFALNTPYAVRNTEHAMTLAPSIPTGYLVALGVAALLNIAIPVVLAVVVRRRLGLSWRYIAYGALIFTLFQLVTRVPAVFALQGVVGPALAGSRPLQIAWLAGLALSAGLFEEVGRYIGYRWLMRGEEKTWPKGVLYGLGHGGIEAVVLVAGLQLIALVNLVVLSTLNLDTLGLSEAQRAQVEQQVAAVAAMPAWMPLLGVWERIWSIAFHVAMSVVVLQGFRRPGGPLVWVALAVALHFLINFVGAGAPLLFGVSGTEGALVSEGIIALFGLASLLLIWRLRPAGGGMPPPPLE
jgi:uncharacterized membrane protein YhfC